MGTVVVPPMVNDPLVLVSVIPRPREFALLTFVRGGSRRGAWGQRQGKRDRSSADLRCDFGIGRSVGFFRRF